MQWTHIALDLNSGAEGFRIDPDLSTEGTFTSACTPTGEDCASFGVPEGVELAPALEASLYISKNVNKNISLAFRTNISQTFN